MICGGASSSSRPQYCCRACRGGSHTLSVASWLSWLACWPPGTGATKKRVSKRLLLTDASRGVIQRAHGVSWLAFSRSAIIAITSSNARPSRSSAVACAASALSAPSA
jgi:hypothetical protein